MRHLAGIALPLMMFGFATPKAHGPPLACSLTPDQLRERRDDLLPGLVRRADEVTELDSGWRLRFQSKDGLLAEIARVIEQERACCSFLRFQVTAEPNGGPITVEVTGPPGTREILQGLR
jgi:hypothetical protein